jgi:hypothetical protein
VHSLIVTVEPILGKCRLRSVVILPDFPAMNLSLSFCGLAQSGGDDPRRRSSATRSTIRAKVLFAYRHPAG